MFLVNMAIFLVVLGLLVFVHELGHFVAAKACGVFCGRFSLGMPPRLFGVKIGETDYCIGALPFGGYVKMAGQEDAPLTEEEREREYGDLAPDRWFNNKPVWQRTIILAAGPTMNFLLAIVLYCLVAALGAEVPQTQLDSRIGMVKSDRPAASAPMYLMDEQGKADTNREPDTQGWQTGDRIVSINGTEIANIHEVAMNAALGGGNVQNIVIERTEPDGTKKRYLSPTAAKTPKDGELAQFGVAPFDEALVGGVMDSMPAVEAGIQADDVISRANGQWVDKATFTKMVEDIPEGGSIAMQIKRGEQTLDMTLLPKTLGRILDVSFGVSQGKLEDAAQSPAEILDIEEALSKSTGLRRGDIVLEVAGQTVSSEQLFDFEQAHPGETVTVKIRRPAVMFGLLRQEGTKTAEIAVASVRAIGVQWGNKTVFHRVPPSEIVPEGFRQAYRDLGHTLRTVQMLITGKLSATNLGGPVMIYQVTTQAAHVGYYWLINIVAFISINLCVLNFLPLPALDGGQSVLNWVEGIRRKPVQMKTVERYQLVGLTLIIALMLFVTYNDIWRWVQDRMF
ncbi:MAG: hypothetical protein QG656_2754 [Candidatus Hydrogenedentes bacterium]|nr:hypothetical protein [Candidatus Hydrogenedentota bacterium]